MGKACLVAYSPTYNCTRVLEDWWALVFGKVTLQLIHQLLSFIKIQQPETVVLDMASDFADYPTIHLQ